MTAGDLNLPSGLRWIAYVAGSEWPRGSEHGMFDLADCWSGGSDQLNGLVSEVEGAVGKIFEAYPQGDANASFKSSLNVLTDAGNSGSVPAIAASMGKVAESCNKVGCSIQEYKIQVVVGLSMLLFDIAVAWIFPLTAPAVEAAEISMAQVWAGMLKVLLREAIIAAIEQGVVQGAVDAAIQLYQWLGEHRRDGVDFRELGESALGGALGGFFGVAGAQVVGRAFDYAMDGAFEGAIGEGFDGVVRSAVGGVNKGVERVFGTEEKFSGDVAAATARSVVGNVLEAGAAGIAGAAGGGLAPVAFGQGYSLSAAGLAGGAAGVLGAGVRGVRSVQDGGAGAEGIEHVVAETGGDVFPATGKDPGDPGADAEGAATGEGLGGTGADVGGVANTGIGDRPGIDGSSNDLAGSGPRVSATTSGSGGDGSVLDGGAAEPPRGSGAGDFSDGVGRSEGGSPPSVLSPGEQFGAREGGSPGDVGSATELSPTASVQGSGSSGRPVPIADGGPASKPVVSGAASSDPGRSNPVESDPVRLGAGSSPIGAGAGKVGSVESNTSRAGASQTDTSGSKASESAFHAGPKETGPVSTGSPRVGPESGESVTVKPEPERAPAAGPAPRQSTAVDPASPSSRSAGHAPAASKTKEKTEEPDSSEPGAFLMLSPDHAGVHSDEAGVDDRATVDATPSGTGGKPPRRVPPPRVRFAGKMAALGGEQFFRSDGVQKFFENLHAWMAGKRGQVFFKGTDHVVPGASTERPKGFTGGRLSLRDSTGGGVSGRRPKVWDLSDDRERYRVVVHKDAGRGPRLFWAYSGKPVDTLRWVDPNTPEGWLRSTGQYLLVVDREGNAYVHSGLGGTVTHESFDRVGVYAAGTIGVEGGRIVSVTDRGGPYRSDASRMSSAVQHLGVHVPAVEHRDGLTVWHGAADGVPHGVPKPRSWWNRLLSRSDGPEAKPATGTDPKSPSPTDESSGVRDDSGSTWDESSSTLQDSSSELGGEHFGDTGGKSWGEVTELGSNPSRLDLNTLGKSLSGAHDVVVFGDESGAHYIWTRSGGLTGADGRPIPESRTVDSVLADPKITDVRVPGAWDRPSAKQPGPDDIGSHGEVLGSDHARTRPNETKSAHDFPAVAEVPVHDPEVYRGLLAAQERAERDQQQLKEKIESSRDTVDAAKHAFDTAAAAHDDTRVSEARVVYVKAQADHRRTVEEAVDRLMDEAKQAGTEPWQAYRDGRIGKDVAFQLVSSQRVTAAKAAAEALLEHYDIQAGKDRSGPLARLSTKELEDRILNGGSDKNSRTAQIELMRRGTGGKIGGPGGKVLRWTQLSSEILMHHGPVEMDTGEGKELTAIARATRTVLKEGIAHVMTSSDPLVVHMQHEFEKLVGGDHGLGIDVYHLDSDKPFPDRVQGRKLIVVGTAQDYGFRAVKEAQAVVDKLKENGMPDHELATLRTSLENAPSMQRYKELLDNAAKDRGLPDRFEPFPGGDLIIDEIDAQLIDEQTHYVLSPGKAGKADAEFEQHVRQVRKNLQEAKLGPEDFGKDPEKRGVFDSRLTPDGRAKLADKLGREVGDAEAEEYSHAAQAEWGPEQNSDYHVSHDKIKIIASQTNDQVMDDPEKQSSSRWNGFAKYLEAKHNLPITADSEHSLSITGKQIFSGGYFGHITGMSGTLLTPSKGNPRGVEDVMHEEFGTGPISKVDRFFTSQLQRHDAKHFASGDEKFAAMANDILNTAFVQHPKTEELEQKGPPQLAIAMDNADVARLADALNSAAETRGLHVEFSKLDVAWVDSRGSKEKANKELQDIIAGGGQMGRIILGNKMMGRGVDITPSEAAIAAGGLRVKISGGPAYSERVNHQAETRTARSGDPNKDPETGGTPGEAVHYISPEDYRSAAPNTRVKTLITQYRDAATAHRDAVEANKQTPTRDTQNAVEKTESELKTAENKLRNTATPLQKAAVEQQILNSRRSNPHSSRAPPLDDDSGIHNTPTPPPQARNTFNSAVAQNNSSGPTTIVQPPANDGSSPAAATPPPQQPISSSRISRTPATTRRITSPVSHLVRLFARTPSSWMNAALGPLHPVTTEGSRTHTAGDVSAIGAEAFSPSRIGDVAADGAAAHRTPLASGDAPAPTSIGALPTAPDDPGAGQRETSSLDAAREELPGYPAPPTYTASGNCGVVTLDLWAQFTGRQVQVPFPAVGLTGLTVEQVEGALGVQLQEFTDHGAVAEALMSREHGAVAVVVDVYRGPVDANGVGAHAYLLRVERLERNVADREGNIVRVHDQVEGPVRVFPPVLPPGRELAGRYAALFTSDGRYLPSGSGGSRLSGQTRIGARSDDSRAVSRVAAEMTPSGVGSGSDTTSARAEADPSGELLDRLGGEETLFDSFTDVELTGTVNPERGRFDRPGLEPPMLDPGDFLHELTPERKEQLLPVQGASIKPVRHDYEKNFLVLIDQAGEVSVLPTNLDEVEAELVVLADGRPYLKILQSEETTVHIDTELVQDMLERNRPDHLTGTLSWNVPGGEVRFLGYDDADQLKLITVAYDDTLVVKPGPGQSRWIKLPSNPEWIRVEAPDEILPASSALVGRHDDPLFGEYGPRPEDVRQGNIGDCFLLAPLKWLAARDPQAIVEAMHDYGDGTVGVRFLVDGRPEWVRVEKEFYDPPIGIAYKQGEPLWAVVIEKAYARRFGEGNGYHGIWGGFPVEAMRYLDKGFRQAGDGGIQQPASSVGDYAFLHPLLFDANTLHTLINGYMMRARVVSDATNKQMWEMGLEFSRAVADTYDHWQQKFFGRRAQAVDRLENEQPADVDAVWDEFLRTEDLLSPPGFRKYLDDEFPGKWEIEKDALVAYLREVTPGHRLPRDLILPDEFRSVGHAMGARIDYALRRSTVVTLATLPFGQGNEDFTAVPGLAGSHVYAVLAVERDTTGVPVRVLLENPSDFNKLDTTPVDGIEYRLDPEPGRAGYIENEEEGFLYRVASDGIEYRIHPNGDQYRGHPDGTYVRIYKEGGWLSRNRKGDIYRKYPDGSKYWLMTNNTQFLTSRKGRKLRAVDKDWVPDNRVVDPPAAVMPRRAGVVAVDIKHLPKFLSLSMSGPGARGVHGVGRSGLFGVRYATPSAWGGGISRLWSGVSPHSPTGSTAAGPSLTGRVISDAGEVPAARRSGPVFDGSASVVTGGPDGRPYPVPTTNSFPAHEALAQIRIGSPPNQQQLDAIVGGIPAPAGHGWESMPPDGDCFYYVLERVVYHDTPPATPDELDQRIRSLRVEVAHELSENTDTYFRQFHAILTAAAVPGAGYLDYKELQDLILASNTGRLWDSFSTQIQDITNRGVWRNAISHVVPQAAGAVLARRGLTLRVQSPELRTTAGWTLGEDTRATPNATVLVYGNHYYLAVSTHTPDPTAGATSIATQPGRSTLHMQPALPQTDLSGMDFDFSGMDLSGTEQDLFGNDAMDLSGAGEDPFGNDAPSPLPPAPPADHPMQEEQVSDPRPKIKELTDAQRAALEAFAELRGYVKAAAKLGQSYKSTVREHVRKAAERLGVTVDRAADLQRQAVERGNTVEELALLAREHPELVPDLTEIEELTQDERAALEKYAELDTYDKAAAALGKKYNRKVVGQYVRKAAAKLGVKTVKEAVALQRRAVDLGMLVEDVAQLDRHNTAQVEKQVPDLTEIKDLLLRESTALEQFAIDKKYDEAAERLGLGKSTVKKYVQSAAAKLGQDVDGAAILQNEALGRGKLVEELAREARENPALVPDLTLPRIKDLTEIQREALRVSVELGTPAKAAKKQNKVGSTVLETVQRAAKALGVETAQDAMVLWIEAAKQGIAVEAVARRFREDPTSVPGLTRFKDLKDLTEFQREALRESVELGTYAEAAKKLDKGDSTVGTHMKLAAGRLGVKTAQEAKALWIEAAKQGIAVEAVARRFREDPTSVPGLTGFGSNAMYPPPPAPPATGAVLDGSAVAGSRGRGPQARGAVSPVTASEFRSPDGALPNREAVPVNPDATTRSGLFGVRHATPRPWGGDISDLSGMDFDFSGMDLSGTEQDLFGNDAMDLSGAGEDPSGNYAMYPPSPAPPADHPMQHDPSQEDFSWTNFFGAEQDPSGSNAMYPPPPAPPVTGAVLDGSVVAGSRGRGPQARGAVSPVTASEFRSPDGALPNREAVPVNRAVRLARQQDSERRIGAGAVRPVRGVVEAVNDCGPRALARLVELTGSRVVRVPGPVGLGGMTRRELQAAAGGVLQLFEGHRAVERELLALEQEGAVAVVVDTYRGWVDGFGVGAHAYLLQVMSRGVVVIEPVAGSEGVFPPKVRKALDQVHAIMYRSDGVPVFPLTGPGSKAVPGRAGAGGGVPGEGEDAGAGAGDAPRIGANPEQDWEWSGSPPPDATTRSGLFGVRHATPRPWGGDISDLSGMDFDFSGMDLSGTEQDPSGNDAMYPPSPAPPADHPMQHDPSREDFSWTNFFGAEQDPSGNDAVYPPSPAPPADHPMQHDPSQEDFSWTNFFGAEQDPSGNDAMYPPPPAPPADHPMQHDPSQEDFSWTNWEWSGPPPDATTEPADPGPAPVAPKPFGRSGELGGSGRDSAAGPQRTRRGRREAPGPYVRGIPGVTGFPGVDGSRGPGESLGQSGREVTARQTPAPRTGTRRFVPDGAGTGHSVPEPAPTPAPSSWLSGLSDTEIQFLEIAAAAGCDPERITGTPYEVTIQLVRIVDLSGLSFQEAVQQAIDHGVVSNGAIAGPSRREPTPTPQPAAPFGQLPPQRIQDPHTTVAGSPPHTDDPIQHEHVPVLARDQPKIGNLPDIQREYLRAYADSNTYVEAAQLLNEINKTTIPPHAVSKAVKLAMMALKAKDAEQAKNWQKYATATNIRVEDVARNPAQVPDLNPTEVVDLTDIQREYLQAYADSNTYVEAAQLLSETTRKDVTRGAVSDVVQWVVTALRAKDAKQAKNWQKYAKATNIRVEDVARDPAQVPDLNPTEVVDLTDTQRKYLQAYADSNTYVEAAQLLNEINKTTITRQAVSRAVKLAMMALKAKDAEQAKNWQKYAKATNIRVEDVARNPAQVPDLNPTEVVDLTDIQREYLQAYADSNTYVEAAQLLNEINKTTIPPHAVSKAVKLAMMALKAKDAEQAKNWQKYATATNIRVEDVARNPAQVPDLNPTEVVDLTDIQREYLQAYADSNTYVEAAQLLSETTRKDVTRQAVSDVVQWVVTALRAKDGKEEAKNWQKYAKATNIRVEDVARDPAQVDALNRFGVEDLTDTQRQYLQAYADSNTYTKDGKRSYTEAAQLLNEINKTTITRQAVSKAVELAVMALKAEDADEAVKWLEEAANRNPPTTVEQVAREHRRARAQVPGPGSVGVPPADHPGAGPGQAGQGLQPTPFAPEPARSETAERADRWGDGTAGLTAPAAPGHPRDRITPERTDPRAQSNPGPFGRAGEWGQWHDGASAWPAPPPVLADDASVPSAHPMQPVEEVAPPENAMLRTPTYNEFMAELPVQESVGDPDQIDQIDQIDLFDRNRFSLFDLERQPELSGSGWSTLEGVPWSSQQDGIDSDRPMQVDPVSEQASVGHLGSLGPDLATREEIPQESQQGEGAFELEQWINLDMLDEQDPA